MVAELQAFMIIFSKKIVEVSKKTSVRYKKSALLRQTAEGAWGKAPKNFIKKKNIKK